MLFAARSPRRGQQEMRRTLTMPGNNNANHVQRPLRESFENLLENARDPFATLTR